MDPNHLLTVAVALMVALMVTLMIDPIVLLFVVAMKEVLIVSAVTMGMFAKMDPILVMVE